MKRASTILESTRLDRQLNFEEISKRTRIPIHYLIAFENEDISQFPSEPYCSLMVKDYADFLGLNGEDLLALFRRDHDRRTQNLRPRRTWLTLTPQLALKIFIAILVILFSLYLLFEYLKFNRPPQLKVAWPDTLTGLYVDISGTTDPEATIKINDSLVIVDTQGNFKKTVEVATTEAKIFVEAQSPAGVVTQEEKIYK